MRRPLAALTCAALLATALPAHAYVLLDGPMPSLNGRKPAPKPVDPHAYTPAPRPDVDVLAPVSRPAQGAVVVPGLTNRSAVPSAPTTAHPPGSAFSDTLNRGNRRSSPELGGTLVPSLNLKMPLQ